MEIDNNRQGLLEDKTNYICGLSLKKGFSLKNLVALFYINFMVVSFYGYCNVQSVYILRSPDLFGVPQDQTGRVISKMMFLSFSFSIGAVLVAGYTYDLVGRKKLILLYLTFLSLCCFFFPRTAPSIALLTVLRTLMQMFGVSIMSHPLINDYIKKESRGKAVAITAVGTLGGEAFSVIVLFGITKRMELAMGFSIVSIALAVLSLPLTCLITEPKIKAKQIGSDMEGQKLLQRNESMTLAEATEGMTKMQKI